MAPVNEKIVLNLLKRCHHSLVSLKMYIDQMHGDNPVVWIGDRKTPVSKMPDYIAAAVLINELDNIITPTQA